MEIVGVLVVLGVIFMLSKAGQSSKPKCVCGLVNCHCRLNCDRCGLAVFDKCRCPCKRCGWRPCRCQTF